MFDRAPKCSFVPLPGPFRYGPPRCFAGLQRMTIERSRCCGLATPPSSFLPYGMDLDVFRSIAVWSVSLPAELPLMTLQSLSRTSSVYLVGVHGELTKALRLFRPSSRRVLRPFDAPSSENPLPDPLLPAFPCGFAFFFGSRRGFPGPLCSVFAVFRDLDGLLFSEPCDVFRSLTPLRFTVPLSHTVV